MLLVVLIASKETTYSIIAW